MKRFPSTLYVKVDGDKDEEYFVADDAVIGMAEIGQKTRAAIYTLTEIIEVEGVPSIKRLPLKKKAPR